MQQKNRKQFFYKLKGTLQRAERERGQGLRGTGSIDRLRDGDSIVSLDSDIQVCYYHYHHHYCKRIIIIIII